MCRIAGIVDFTGALNNEIEKIAIKMRDSLSHGGPDDAGLYVSQDKRVALGNRRLAIIDLSLNGHQPMSNKDSTVWITYNGEIYNFQDLRQELKIKNYQFKSKTDTEVLIYGYEEWGIEGLLSKLRGMFAFAIYDSREKDTKLFLARDRFGIKPLYYYKDKEKFLFASEVKGIKTSGLIKDEKNLQSLISFLQYGSIPYPLTTVKNVFSLGQGQYIKLSNDSFEIKNYWNVTSFFHNARSNQLTQDETINQTRDLLLESVKLHLISDVPLGVFLSGGIDSSSIVSLASKLNTNPITTLSIIFEEEKYTEANYSKLVAKKYNTNHKEVLIKSTDFMSALPNIFLAMDEPTIDGVNTYFVSKAAKEAGLTVVLSGLGGDEVFLGYPYYRYANNLSQVLNFLKFLPKNIRKNLLGLSSSVGATFKVKSFEKILYLEEPSVKNSYLMFRGLFTQRQIQDLLLISEGEFKSLAGLLSSPSNGLDNSLSLAYALDFYDFNHYLQNQLLKDTDFMSMWHAVEVRVPFLDHVLVEKVIGFPLCYKINSLFNKPLLAKAFKKEIPGKIIKRKKMGFTFPMEKWIKKYSNNFIETPKACGILNTKEVQRFWDDFNKGNIHWSRVWALVVLSNFNIKSKETIQS